MFATPQDLADKLQEPVPTTAANMALKSATARIITATGQSFTYVADDVILIPGGGAERIMLPGPPVYAVSDVQTRWAWESTWSVQPQGNGYRLEAGELVWIGFAPVNNPLYGSFWAPQNWPTEVQVTYTHGPQTYPDDVVACCLQLAAESMASPDGTTFERTDDYVYRRPAPAESIAELQLKGLVKRYGRRAYSVRARR